MATIAVKGNDDDDNDCDDDDDKTSQSVMVTIDSFSGNKSHWVNA